MTTILFNNNTLDSKLDNFSQLTIYTTHTITTSKLPCNQQVSCKGNRVFCIKLRIFFILKKCYIGHLAKNYLSLIVGC